MVTEKKLGEITSLNEYGAALAQRYEGVCTSRVWRQMQATGTASPDGQLAMVDLTFDDGTAKRFFAGTAHTEGGTVRFDLLDDPSEVEPPVPCCELRTMPYSEVCMHMRVAGKAMWTHRQPGGMVQLYDEAGRKFSFPIVLGEAGLR